VSKEYLSFKKDSPEVKKLIEWWKGLDNDRGERAILRRCHNPTEVVFSPAYHRLRQELRLLGTVDDDKLALVVGLTARIKPPEDNSGSIAEQMATGKSDDSARVSGLRFRRLLKIKDRETLFTSMTRVIALLGSSGNIQSIAQCVYCWNDITRKQWALDYYSKAPNEK
jgi:CRISPR system Cascade subunit CasB